RCVAVHSPFLAKRFCTVQRARYNVYALIILAFVFFSSTFPIIYIADFMHKKCIIRAKSQKMIRYVKPIIFYCIPDVLLLANLFVIYELWLASRMRKKTLINPEASINLHAANFNRKQTQLTLMLVSVSISFYIFTTPAIIDYILQMNPPKRPDVKKLKSRFLRTNLTTLLLQLNSATNFIFYCLAGKKFRTACIETIKESYEHLVYVWYRYIMNRKNYEKKHRYDMRLSGGYLSPGPLGENDIKMGDGGRRRTQSTSVVLHNYNTASKRASNETILSSNLYSRKQSRV
ncbi:unnamed protein product, partial [Didymodactylos carnosus]